MAACFVSLNLFSLFISFAIMTIFQPNWQNLFHFFEKILLPTKSTQSKFFPLSQRIYVQFEFILPLLMGKNAMKRKVWKCNWTNYGKESETAFYLPANCSRLHFSFQRFFACIYFFCLKRTFMAHKNWRNYVVLLKWTNAYYRVEARAGRHFSLKWNESFVTFPRFVRLKISLFQ